MSELEPRTMERVHAYDPSIEVLWNNRIGRWVVVQDLQKTPHPRWITPSDKLVGCQEVGEKTQFKALFLCEETLSGFESIPVKPTADYIVLRLARDTRHFGDMEAFKKIEATWDKADADEEKDDIAFVEDSILKPAENFEKGRVSIDLGKTDP